MKNNIYSKLIILLALILCLTACEGAVHLPENTTPVSTTPEPAAAPEPAADPEPAVIPPEPVLTSKITFNANGGTGNMNEQTVEQNIATALTANAFSRNGYSFIGWNTTADFTDTPPYTDLQNVTLSEDLTLYAMWEGIEYTITYVLDSPNSISNFKDTPAYFTGDHITSYICGNTTVLPQNVDKDTWDDPASSTASIHYYFDGWYNSDFTVEIEEITPLMFGNLELYAKYGEINYK